MAQFNLGQVAIVPRGAYAGAATYNKLDAVTDNGGCYLCLADNTTGVEPGVTSGWTSYWTPMTVGISSFGATGSGGLDAAWTITLSWTLSDGTTGSSTVNMTALPDHSVGTQQLVTNLTYSAVNLTADQVRPIKIVSSESQIGTTDGVYLVTG